METHFKKWNTAIDEWKAKLEKARGEAQVAYQSEIQDLRERIKEMQHRVEELKGASNQTWKMIKTGLEKSAVEIKRSIDVTLRRIAESERKKRKELGSSKKCVRGKDRCKVTFILPGIAAPDAKSVYLVGDFNKWDTHAHCMKKEKNGNYSISLTLESGKEYQFRYLIDGFRWENDWNADRYVKSPYGDSENSVIIV